MHFLIDISPRVLLAGVFFLLFGAYSAPSNSSEPSFLDWDQIEVSINKFKVSAKETDRYFEYFRIETEWGASALNESQIKQLRRPNLKSLNAVSFPLTIDASEHEYHIQLTFRGDGFSDREDACWDDDKYLPEDFARIYVNDTGVYDVKTFRFDCKTIED